LTERERVLEARAPRNEIFVPGQPIAPLGDGEMAASVEFDRLDSQNLLVLRLAPDAVLTPRYHTGSDLTLFIVSGSGIVEIEGARYFVEPGAAAVIPRLIKYSIRPHQPDDDAARTEMVVLQLFNPPYDPMGVVQE
jgi:mannose-6-phosphate isomerase-like protein (cupin superfamily)